jgi:hypothetical protein
LSTLTFWRFKKFRQVADTSLPHASATAAGKLSLGHPSKAPNPPTDQTASERRRAANRPARPLLARRGRLEIGDVLKVLVVTNTSVNPARSIGPTLFAGVPHIAQLWLFIIAPLIGAVAAGLVTRALRPENR